LYPPSEINKLYPHGKLDVHHDNGLISYEDAPVRSDGLPVRVALKARVKALEEKLDAVPKGKGKGRMDTKERGALMEAYERALDELAQFTLEAADGIDVDEEEDDFDALMAGLEDDDDAALAAMGGEDGDLAEPNGEDEEDESSDEETEYPEWNGIGMDDDSDEEKEDGDEPSSFSRIPTALVHQHLGLETTAKPPADVSLDRFPKFRRAKTPFVIELSAGQMLYLPASWWHEVTSSSAGDSDPVHMAFNYWFYPPNKLDSFEQPYEDSLVWEYLRSKDESRRRLETNKRKANGTNPQVKKKSKQ
jgi:hypothetical protein